MVTFYCTHAGLKSELSELGGVGGEGVARGVITFYCTHAGPDHWVEWVERVWLGVWLHSTAHMQDLINELKSELGGVGGEGVARGVVTFYCIHAGPDQ
jgi:hypothetical protein